MRKNVKKLAATALSLVMLGSVLTGCGAGKDAAITVVSREDGSGTRGAFTELMGIMVDDRQYRIYGGSYQFYFSHDDYSSR